jgi:hypothetical protein
MLSVNETRLREGVRFRQFSLIMPKFLGQPFVAVSGAGDFAAGGFDEPLGADEVDVADCDHALLPYCLANGAGDFLAPGRERITLFLVTARPLLGEEALRQG